MLTKFLNLVSVLFVGVIFGASLAFLGCGLVLDKDGYDIGIKKEKETEKNED